MNELLLALLKLQMKRDFENYYKNLTSSMDTPKEGKTEVEKGDGYVKKTWTSEDGSSRMISYISEMFENDINSMFGDQMNSREALQIDLDIERKEESLENAVKKEEFEDATKLRDELVVLKENRSKIEELQVQKEDAINNEEFEKANELKLEIENLTNPTSADS